MIKYFIALLFVGLTLPRTGDSRFLNRCYNIFRSSPNAVSYDSLKGDPLYSQEILSSLLPQLSLLEGKSFSKKEVENYKKNFESLISQIKSLPESSIASRWSFIEDHWLSAVQAFPQILSFINSGKAAEYESLDTKAIIQIGLSALGWHTVAYLTHPETEKLDGPRFLLILKSLSDFKDRPHVFSLYKIIRAVQGKYSLKEYIHCK